MGDQGEIGGKRSATGQKVVPNVEALVDDGGMRGEEKPVVERLEDEVGAALLRLLGGHGLDLRRSVDRKSGRNCACDCNKRQYPLHWGRRRSCACCWGDE